MRELDDADEILTVGGGDEIGQCVGVAVVVVGGELLVVLVVDLDGGVGPTVDARAYFAPRDRSDSNANRVDYVSDKLTILRQLLIPQSCRCRGTAMDT